MMTAVGLENLRKTAEAHQQVLLMVPRGEGFYVLTRWKSDADMHNLFYYHKTHCQYGGDAEWACEFEHQGKLDNCLYKLTQSLAGYMPAATAPVPRQWKHNRVYESDGFRGRAGTNGEGNYSHHPVELDVLVAWEGVNDTQEINVYFDPNVWDKEAYGLIYSDPQFLDDVKMILRKAGFKYWNGLSYSESGMQGEDYVNLDASHRLTQEWQKRFAKK